jgi:hypothetical protein
MTDKIVALRGGNIEHGEPNHEVVQMLENLLGKARSGHLLGIAFAAVCEGGVRERGWSCESGQDEVLAFQLMRVVHRLNTDMDKTEGGR